MYINIIFLYNNIMLTDNITTINYLMWTLAKDYYFNWMNNVWFNKLTLILYIFFNTIHLCRSIYKLTYNITRINYVMKTLVEEYLCLNITFFQIYWKSNARHNKLPLITSHFSSTLNIYAGVYQTNWCYNKDRCKSCNVNAC